MINRVFEPSAWVALAETKWPSGKTKKDFSGEFIGVARAPDFVVDDRVASWTHRDEKCSLRSLFVDVDGDVDSPVERGRGPRGPVFGEDGEDVTGAIEFFVDKTGEFEREAVDAAFDFVVGEFVDETLFGGFGQVGVIMHRCANGEAVFTRVNSVLGVEVIIDPTFTEGGKCEVTLAVTIDETAGMGCPHLVGDGFVDCDTVVVGRFTRLRVFDEGLFVGKADDGTIDGVVDAVDDTFVITAGLDFKVRRKKFPNFTGRVTKWRSPNFINLLPIGGDYKLLRGVGGDALTN